MSSLPVPSSPPAPAPGLRGVGGKKRRPQTRARRLLRWTLPVVTAAAAGVLVGIGVAVAIHVPRVEALSEFRPGLITQLYDRHDLIFATYARESRVLLEEGEIPPVLQNAIVAAEDAKFFQHGGVDALGVVRAALEDIRTRRFAQGASTITMQLARMLYFTREKTWKRKIEETFVAVELEKRLSKQQILTLYCNLINLGHGNYGVEAASRFFFNKSVAELSLPEAATLAAIIQRPSKLSPHNNAAAVLDRRNLVLQRMREEDLITESAYEEASAEPLLVVKRRPKNQLGPYFAEEIRRYLEANYGVRGLYERGLQVRTTLDLEMQRVAEDALRSGLRAIDRKKGWRGPILHLEDEDLESQHLPSWTGRPPLPGSWNEGIVLSVDRRSAQVKVDQSVYTLDSQGIEWTKKSSPRELLKPGDVAWFRLEVPEPEGGDVVLVLEQEPELEGAVVLLESATGAIRAMVGGWDFQRNQFNRVTQARRQVGSAFKPFVYGAALETGFTAADTLFDGPVVFANAENLLTYSPRNYYRKYYGVMTLRRGLELSINVTSVKLLDLVGAERAVEFARRCGIASELFPYPSLALGAADLSPLELAAGYATMANQGIHVEPYLVESITTPDGRVLETHQPRASKAMEPEIAYTLTHILEGVIDHGTARKVAYLELDLAGKTGTTDDYTDAWFVGYTPHYTLLVWVGYDQKKKIGPKMTGAEAALPVWEEVITQGLEDGWLHKDDRFTVPPGISFLEVEHMTGLLPTTGTERTVLEAFVAGTEPVQDYDPSWATVLKLPWYQQRAFYRNPKEGERMPDDVVDWELVKEAWDAK